MLGPNLFFCKPSRAKLFDKASQAELPSEKMSQDKLFAFKTEPNQAFAFPKLSYFELFSVDFFKEYKFLVENALLLTSSGLYLKRLATCGKIAHFLFLKVTWFYE